MEFHGVDVRTQFKKMRELVPEAYRAFLEFDQKAFKDGAIPGKMKELIELTEQRDVLRQVLGQRSGVPRPKLAGLRYQVQGLLAGQCTHSSLTSSLQPLRPASRQ